jgi:hypothetical protein
MKKTLLILMAVGLVGCASSGGTKRLAKISIGMEKGAVIKAIGAPDVVRGSIKNKHDQIVEVWEYRLARAQSGSEGAGRAAMAVFTFGMSLGMDPVAKVPYWLTFVDGKLNKWGQAGDWKKEADFILEHRFR